MWGHFMTTRRTMIKFSLSAGAALAFFSASSLVFSAAETNKKFDYKEKPGI